VARREGIGARLKRLRLGRGLSQRDLSSPGISYAYISRIEAGLRTPSVKALRRIAGKLGARSNTWRQANRPQPNLASRTLLSSTDR